MSESRSGESRSYTPFYSVYSSESRSGESREDSYEYIPSCSSSSRPTQITSSPTQTSYNSIEEIDALIEQLQSSQEPSIKTPRINKAISKRKKQIEELKRLREKLNNQKAEEDLARRLEEENEEVDAKIRDLKENITLRKTYNPSSSVDTSESRSSSSESRW